MGAACVGQTIPLSVTTKLTKAEGLIDPAATSSAGKARTLLERAAGPAAGVSQVLGASSRHAQPAPEFPLTGAAPQPYALLDSPALGGAGCRPIFDGCY
jgi:hypothetical protein